MGWPVVTVASGGLPVIDVTGTFPRLGVPVSEAANGRGTPVTKVVAPRMALAVTFVVPPLLMLAGAADGREADRDRAGPLARGPAQHPGGTLKPAVPVRDLGHDAADRAGRRKILRE
jgi:hypothetical protein